MSTTHVHPKSRESGVRSAERGITIRRNPRAVLRSWRLLPVSALLLLVPLLALGGSMAGAQPGGQPVVARSQQSGYLVLRVYFSNTAELDRLASELDAQEVSSAGGYLTVISDQVELESLRAKGVRVDIDEKLTANINTPIKFGNSPDNFYGGYHTVDEMQAFMDREAATYPNLAEKVNLGPSWCKSHPGRCTQPDTWNGFDLYTMHITNRNIPGPKPVFWFNSGIHAREIAPPELALDFIDYLLSGYASDADAHWLVDYQDIWVMLPNNPDGHHVVESGGDNPVSVRKNQNQDNGCTSYPLFGTDNNRNFPFMWACCGGSSTDPCREDYHGGAANSEDETQAVVNKIRALIPDQRGPGINDAAPITTTGTFLDMHSFSPVDLWPWANSRSRAPNDADLRNLTFHIASTTADPPGNDYTPCQFGSCLYIADGTTNDWVYGELGAAAFAEEIGEVFFPTYTETQTLLWPRNRGMLLYLSKVARMPYLMTRGPDTSLVSAEPMTVTQGIATQLSASINYAWDYHGAYSNYIQNVAAAEYYLDTPPWAGGTPVAMQAADGGFDSPTEAVQATVQTGGIPVGRHILFVRGRGANSYEGYQSWGPVSATWLVVQPYVTPIPTVTGTPPTLTPTRTLSPTVTSTATPCAASAIQNGGFETGSFVPGWTVLDTNPTPVVSGNRRHGGSHAAFIGNVPGVEPLGDASIYQQFTVPAEGGTLSFWYYPFSRDHVQFDWQEASITDADGNTLATLMHVCEGTETWTNFTSSLDAYRGQTIRVKFLVHQDGAGDVTNMYVDDVMLLEPCSTPVVPTATPTVHATVTLTAVRSATAVNTGTPTSIPTTAATTTATPCPMTFMDVQASDYFYEAVRYLYCHGVVSGYGDNSFRPYNNSTRGQLTKIVVIAEGFPLDTTGGPHFTDVPMTNAFYAFIETAYNRGLVSGYSDGTFRWGNDITRGQLSKVIVQAEGWLIDTAGGPHFSDVPTTHPFYSFVETAYNHGIISGYSDGTFRPYNNATRGQISVIVYRAISQP